jgi:hypothetical protein
MILYVDVNDLCHLKCSTCVRGVRAIPNTAAVMPLAAREVAAKTPPNSVVVVFGTNWGADVPFYARRRGIVLANFFPPPLINEVLFENPARWLTGRNIGAVVDCNVFSNQETTPELAAIRDKLIAMTGATPQRIDGSVVGSTSSSLPAARWPWQTLSCHLPWTAGDGSVSLYFRGSFCFSAGANS